MSKLYVVGIGPGAYEKMTMEACEALKNSDVIIGYTVYVDLVRDHFPGKEFLTTPMKKEVDRCVLAFEEAKKRKDCCYDLQWGCRSVWHVWPYVRSRCELSGGRT